MIDLKPIVVQALKNDPALSALIAGRVIFMSVPDSPVYPCITYYEQNNLPAFFADNQEKASELVFVIDVWSQGSTTAIANEVDRIMKSLGFARVFAADLYENDTKVYHKSMRFVIGKMI